MTQSPELVEVTQADEIAAANYVHQIYTTEALRTLEEAFARYRIAIAAHQAELVEAAIALRDDMIMRAKMNRRKNGGEVIVEASNGVWVRFCHTIDASVGAIDKVGGAA